MKFRLVVRHLGVRVVAPHAGAWIEIPEDVLLGGNLFVAPHAGAWIEMPHVMTLSPASTCRAPRGRVD